MWEVLSGVNPVWAEVGLVLSGTAEGRTRRGSNERGMMVREERRKREALVWEEDEDGQVKEEEDEHVGGRIWEVVQMGTIGWTRWTEGGVEVKEE